MKTNRDGGASRRTFLGRAAALAGSAALAGPGSPGDPSSLLADEGSPTVPRSAWQLGCFTRPYSRFGYEETLDGIAAAGFTSVGLMTANLASGRVTLADANPAQIDEIRDLASRRDLAISVTYYGGPPVDRSPDAGVQAMRRLVDHCHQAGCQAIVLGGTTKESLMPAYYDAVAAVCDHAADRGVALVLKPHGGLNATGPQCRQIVERVDHPAFRVWYDPGNIFYYSDGGLDPLDDVASVAGLVTGMCVKDFEPPKNVELNPGDGEVDFPGLMKRLIAGGFRSGPLVVETLAPGDLAATNENAAKAYRYLDSLLGG